MWKKYLHSLVESLSQPPLRGLPFFCSSFFRRQLVSATRPVVPCRSVEKMSRRDSTSDKTPLLGSINAETGQPSEGIVAKIKGAISQINVKLVVLLLVTVFVATANRVSFKVMTNALDFHPGYLCVFVYRLFYASSFLFSIPDNIFITFRINVTMLSLLITAIPLLYRTFINQLTNTMYPPFYQSQFNRLTKKKLPPLI
jgi:hypothetical protein